MIQTLAFPSVRSEVEALNWILLEKLQTAGTLLRRMLTLTPRLPVETSFFAIGNRLTNVPENSASLWTTYEIQSGDLEGLGFWVVFFVGQREGDQEFSVA